MPELQRGCTSSEGEVAGAATGYNWSVVFMLTVPFSMLGTGMLVVRRAVKRGLASRDVNIPFARSIESGSAGPSGSVVYFLSRRSAPFRESACAGVGRQVVDHVVDGLLDRGLPVVAEPGVEAGRW